MLRKLLNLGKKEFEEHFELVKTVEDLSINCLPGDTFNLLWEDEFGVVHDVLSHKIERFMRIDKASIYRLKNALGFKKGLMGIFGEKE